MFRKLIHAHPTVGSIHNNRVKMNQKPSTTGEEDEVGSFIGVVFAGLGLLCLGHSAVWLMIRDDHPTPDSFVGAEGMAAWSVIFMLIGLALWITGRRA